MNTVLTQVIQNARQAGNTAFLSFCSKALTFDKHKLVNDLFSINTRIANIQEAENFLTYADKQSTLNGKTCQTGRVKPSYKIHKYQALAYYVASQPEGERYLVATQKELQEALEDESYAPENGPLMVWAIGYNPAYKYYDFTPVVSYQPE